jgi:two-component sensor histidine kinase
MQEYFSGLCCTVLLVLAHPCLAQHFLSFQTVTLLLLLGTTIGLLYKSYRQRQQCGRKLETKQKEIDEKKERLQQLLQEREWLLKEIHHRVKNNLQIVVSLLNSQLIYLKDDAAIQAIRDIRHRVHCISLVHHKLYQSDNPSTINMPGYVRELAEYLADSYNTSGHIRFELSIESVEMDVSQAVTLGLILNESIVNAIKYAFPGKTTGQITVLLKQNDREQLLLMISDNGKGLPGNFDIGRADSLGMSLMQGLSKDLGGSFSIDSQAGVRIQLFFPNGKNNNTDKPLYKHLY